jgi:hypothetical protein
MGMRISSAEASAKAIDGEIPFFPRGHRGFMACRAEAHSWRGGENARGRVALLPTFP